MPPRGKVESLPKEVKAWLDKALIEGNFSGYELLATELKGKGCDISRSGVHRYGKEFAERIEGIKKSTEMAKMLASEAGDDEGALNDALVRILQDKLFNIVMEMKIDPAKINVASLSKSIADLARASISQKKYMAEVREKAKMAVDSIKDKAKAGGLSEDVIRQIEEQVLGIVR